MTTPQPDPPLAPDGDDSWELADDETVASLAAEYRRADILREQTDGAAGVDG